MSSALYRDYEVDQDLIEELRAKVYEYTRAHPDEIDIEDVRNRIISPEDLANNNVDLNNNKTTDWMLKRLLIFVHRDVNVALEKFVEFFKFRNEFKVRELKMENVLPEEFYDVNPIQISGKDKYNNTNLVIQLKFYKKIPQFEYFIKRGVLYFFEQADLQYEQGINNGLCLVLDTQDFSMSAMDLDLLQFIIKQVPFNYIGLIRNVLAYEVPFLMRYVFKIVESWLPSTTDKEGNKRKFFHVINKKDIDNFIDPDQRPANLQGTYQTMSVVPKNAMPFLTMVKHVGKEIEEENVKKINEFIAEILKTK